MNRLIEQAKVSGHKIVINALSSLGGMPKDLDVEFADVYKKCNSFTMTPRERMYALYKAVEYVAKSKINGDLVECGVWKGGSAMVMAHTLAKMNDTQRKIYLYDTFAGASKPTEKDVRAFDSAPMNKVWEKKQKQDHNELYFASLDEVKGNLWSTTYPEQNLVFVKGKVEDTLESTKPKQIALLRLDTDWYESTYKELKELFPLVAKGGVIIIDDYGHFAGAKEATDKYFSETKTKILLNRVDYTCRIGVKI